MSLVQTLPESPAAPTAPSWRRELAAVCAYFNPCHYQTRLSNYHLFRQGVVKTGLHLLTVECAFAKDEFELTGVDNLIQVRSPDVMWQKERLLSIGIQQLVRDGFSKIAWLDADIRFGQDLWPQYLAKALDESPLVQAFSRATALGANPGQGLVRPGVIFHWQKTKAFEPRQCHIGLAWGARADLLRQTGLYDAAIVGGADAFLLYAPFCLPNYPRRAERLEILAQALYLNPRRMAHFQAWARPFAALVNGKIGWIEGTVEALYHGSLKHRNYLPRQQILANFDPAQDIALNADQCWQWATAKPEMHQRVRDYFVQRREDE